MKLLSGLSKLAHRQAIVALLFQGFGLGMRECFSARTTSSKVKHAYEYEDGIRVSFGESGPALNYSEQVRRPSGLPFETRGMKESGLTILLAVGHCQLLRSRAKSWS